jgi:thiosulfate/3-mercaptopyruvate sulfurtransferase
MDVHGLPAANNQRSSRLKDSFAARRRRRWTAGVVAAAGLLGGCAATQPEARHYFPAWESPRYEALVSVHWVQRLLDYHESGGRGPRPPTYRQDRFVVLEASWAPLEEATEYRGGHVPGAIHVDTDDLENGYPEWRLRDAGELQAAIGRAGITPQTTVVVYGAKLIAAARVWWVLKYAGVADVRLMDGGFDAWKAAGYPVETTVREPRPVEFAAPVSSGLLATTGYVRERLHGERVWLADVRSEEEFSGSASGYDYLDARGRIPSAVPVGDGDDDAHVYKQRDGRLRPPREILAHWRRQGIVSAPEGQRFEREVVFYCGGGWRSSVAFFYAWLLGFENIRNYSDGWSGWSTAYRPDASAKGGTPGWRQEPTGNPIATGNP